MIYSSLYSHLLLGHSAREPFKKYSILYLIQFKEDFLDPLFFSLPRESVIIIIIIMYRCIISLFPFRSADNQ